MRVSRLLGALLAVAVSATAFAQPAIIDWNAKPRSFSQSDYQQMLACSLQSHPDETRRYATYHLLRRDVQTPAQNEADPDSQLMMPALKGCIELKNGEMFPFSLDRLISDWGSAHGLKPAVVIQNSDQLARCAWLKAPEEATKMSESADQMVFIQGLAKVTRFCSPPAGTIDIEEFRAAMRKARPKAPSDGQKN